MEAPAEKGGPFDINLSCHWPREASDKELIHFGRFPSRHCD